MRQPTCTCRGDAWRLAARHQAPSAAAALLSCWPNLLQGLSPETVEYVAAHPSNAYDRNALLLFAQGLYQAGYRDRAASIWSSLMLLEDADRVQQAELLRRCLRCGREPA